MVDLQAVYIRTAAGLKEIRARAQQLTREQRNLLIVVDGKSALGSFAGIVGCAPQAMARVAEPLIRLGLIAVPGAAAVAAEPPSAATMQALIALAEQIFGSHAAPVVRKLETAGDSPADLLASVEAAAKLAKLTIDETQAATFLAEARKRVVG